MILAREVISFACSSSLSVLTYFPAPTQPIFGAVRSTLGAGTEAFFNQRDFSQTDMLVVGLLLAAFRQKRKLCLQQLYDSLNQKVSSTPSNDTLYQATRLLDLIRTFGSKTLILFKLLLLEKRILFFGQDVENLCTVQYSLVSLIPDLLAHLRDVGSPELEIHEHNSDRSSLGAKLGMPVGHVQDVAMQPAHL